MDSLINTYQQSIALVEMSLVCAAALVWLLQKGFQQALPMSAKVILLLIIANLFFWPLGLNLELPLSAYVRGVIGDLSTVTVLLLLSALFVRNQSAPWSVKVAIGLVGLCFYPFALGLGMFDPYGWGYSSVALLIAVLVFALLCAIAKWNRGTWIIGLAIIAWGMQWHESTNLWDYLLDPILVVWAIFGVVATIMKKRKEKARSGYLFRPG
ncbi:MAG: hypothetical protein FGM17_08410 [Polynucleobacter sp.]|uniref:hypothetical protein n=1 Tax=Polynucleobacter sp. TaxID=2029855 RepID=UPI00216BE6CD|nr:hypothetical protein [Polynucleobacter sp.]MBU3670726.1 hypothetical protein [Polynucleobacter sp.]